MAYSCYDSILVEASDYVCCNQMQFDGVDIATGSPNPGEYVNTSIGEIYAGTIAPNGYYYALTATSGNYQQDQLVCCNVTKTNASLLWQTNTTYTYYDYALKETPSQSGSNGIAAGCKYLYTSDGLTLDQRDLNTGSVINSLTIPGGSNSIYTVNSGIAVDIGCGNVYVGSDTAIYIYDENLNPLGSFGGLPGKVNDVVYSKGLISACGDSASSQGFVVQFSLPKAITSTYSTPSKCSACDGSATAIVNCGSGPYTYLWNNGQSTSTITGLCAGIYTITLLNSCVNNYCNPSDTAVVVVPGEPGFSAIVSDSNPSCLLKTGFILVTPSGGKSPYTYSWSNGNTTDKNSDLSAGTYTCTIIDSTGCKYFVSATIVNPAKPDIRVVPSYDSICSGSYIILNASGGKYYKWAPDSELSCDTCPSPTASPTVSVTYTVIGSDSNGCKDSATAYIKVQPTSEPIITGPNQICMDSVVELQATPGFSSYLWQPGNYAGTFITARIDSNTTFSLTVYSAACGDSLKAFYKVVMLPQVSPLILPPTDSICKGDSLQLTAKGGNIYLWSNGSTNSYIYAKDSVQTSYTVTISNNGRCAAQTIATIYIRNPKASLALAQDHICAGTTDSLIATGGISYLWNNGATSSTLIINPTKTGPYKVAVTSLCGTDTLLDTVHVIPLPVPVITGPPSVCKDSNATLIASGGTTYIWSNGKSTTNISIKKITSPTTYTLTAFNGSCVGDTTFTISVIPPPKVTITKDSNICSGDSINLKATGGGTYKWNTTPALTSDSIWVSPASSFSYSVTVTNVCVASASNIITVDIPSLAVSPDTTIFIGDTALLLAYSQSANTKYVWMPNYFLSCNTCPAPLANPPQTTTYTVAAVDGKGCGIDKIVTVYVEPHCYDYEVPNVFTPNGDGINDQLVIKQLQVYENVNYSDFAFSITIYDRWGKVMYKSTLPAQYWNGQYMNTGAKESDGVYFYIITSSCQTNGQAFTYDKKGFVQLIR